MKIRGIISISGQPGLYRIVSQTKFGLVVESLQDGKRFPAYASQKVSALEDISIYTTGDDMPLREVFEKIKTATKGSKVEDFKGDNTKMKEWFSGVVPEYDQDRVYNSDIKKVITWYNSLAAADLLDQEEEEEETAEAAEETTEESTDKKPKAAKKTAAKGKAADKEEDGKEKAAPKKTAAKKKSTAAKKTTPKSASPKSSAGRKSAARKTSAPRKTGG